MLFWNRPTLFESAEKDKRNGGSAKEAIGGADEKVTDMTEFVKGLTYQHELETKVEKARKDHQFDKEANKDLDNHERRGLEAGMDWQERRERGYPPKNEKDDPKSRYNQTNIEEGLLKREAADGIEYGVYWDKNGELMGIYKGEKGSVMCYTPRDKDGNPLTRGSTFTHSHPSDEKDNRQLGLSFSKGDIANHGANERAETRAVAREGTYSIKGMNGRIPDEKLKELKSHSNANTRNFAMLYEKETDPYQRNKLAAKILSLEIDAASDRLIYTRGNGFGHEDSRDGRWFSSAKFATLMAVEHKALAEKYGYKYEFKANAGFEAMERVVSGNYPKSESAALLAKVPSIPPMVANKQYPTPTGISPVDKDGNTIRTQPTQPVVTARGFKIGEAVSVKKTPTKNQTRQNAPAQTPATPTAPVATPTKPSAPTPTTKAPRTPRAVKQKVTDIKPPKQIKTPAIKVAPIGVGTVAPSPTTSVFTKGNIAGMTSLTGGGGFGGGLSGIGGSIFGGR